VPLFRRRRHDQAEPDDRFDDLVGGDPEDGDLDDDVVEDGDLEDVVPDDDASRSRGTAGTTGPWDELDAPDDRPRLDLGGLQLPVGPGIEMRVDVQDEQVVAATLVDGHSAVQVHAFAAPRSSGIWADVRAEIAESLRQSGGSAEEVEGPFGTELRARVPGEVPGAGRQLQPARFVGVDGPRWFLRGLFTGPAATDAAQAGRLEDVFRGIVVVRGGEAMAPRDMLPLRLPREALAAAAEEEQERKPTLDQLDRGPEITETR
jgi:Protein of unknown function (DUF3710)